MGSKNKLKRFNENDTFHNVFQPKREELVDAVYPLKGQWNQQFFKNKNPLVLEEKDPKDRRYLVYKATQEVFTKPSLFTFLFTR